MTVILVFFTLVIGLMQLIFFSFRVLLQNRDPAKTVIWLVITATPVVGIIVYFFFGRSVQRYNKKARRSKLNEPGITQKSRLTKADSLLEDQGFTKQKLVRLLLNNTAAPLTANNQATVLANGQKTFHALFAAMEQAKHHIHLEYYIFRQDRIGKELIELLTRKAKAGVEVRLLVDGWGSRELKGIIEDLNKVGVETAWFLPLKLSFLSKLNLRNHRKIVIVDGKIGFTGGLNIGDEYLSRSKQYGYWRDTFIKLEGDCVHTLQNIFLQDWKLATKRELHGRSYYPRLDNMGNKLIQVAASGPDSGWESILQVFFAAAAGAKRSIYIQTPYFIPDDSTMMALKTAALSGLDVKLLCQGVPDHYLTFWASRSYYEDLLKAGVHVYQYMKGILHAKVLIVDGEIASVGSTNFDIRSFRLNFEINACVYDREFAQQLERDFSNDLAESREILLKEYGQRPLIVRFKESTCRLLSPLL
ncbi:MAG TPA: cardiolipin synthase [Verrucomicrobiae bacterium]|nr:cardiolipin synthase [Verrucomicrobiae bacterium]